MAKKLEHIAFIMDGNGRYAKDLKKDRTFGHAEGAKRIPEIILCAKEQNIQFISFFAFSTENWNRSKKEVSFLMKLLEKNLSKKALNWFIENEVNLNVIGFENKIPKRLKDKIKEFTNTVNIKKFNTKVNIFFNYGSRDEIINAIKVMAEKKLKINHKNFEKSLLTNTLPDVDLLIRTSGEQRISNFMLWQIAYSEIIFESTRWPEYNKEIFNKNIIEYYKRERRFGKENAQ